MAFFRELKSFFVMLLLLFAAAQLNGCATTTSLLEGAAESLAPTVMASLDGVESAAMAIKLSNRVLMELPLSEQDEWPSKLSCAPSGAASLKMGLSLVLSTQGVTISTEIDPETGFPRPTSAFYIFLKERDYVLDKGCNQKDLKYFKSKPAKVYYCALGKRKKKGTVNDYVYRNVLMAYGVVTANKKEIMEMQRDIENTAKGFKTCTYFINKSTMEITDEKIIKRACPDHAFKNEDIEKKLATKVREKQKDKAQAEKAYGKLAHKVYKTSVAGADFTAAAITKILSAIANGARAMPHIKKEFSGLKGAYNIAVLIPRAKNVFKSLYVYKNQLGFQLTVYKTMYRQIKGTYEINDDEPTERAFLRIKAVEDALAELEPKLNLALTGEPVEFTDTEVRRLDVLAAMFPVNQQLKQTLIASLRESIEEDKKREPLVHMSGGDL